MPANPGPSLCSRMPPMFFIPAKCNVPPTVKKTILQLLTKKTQPQSLFKSKYILKINWIQGYLLIFFSPESQSDISGREGMIRMRSDFLWCKKVDGHGLNASWQGTYPGTFLERRFLPTKLTQAIYNLYNCFLTVKKILKI